MTGPCTDVALLQLIAALAGALFVRLHQPVLIAYIVVGLKLDLHLRPIGLVALAIGLGQLPSPSPDWSASRRPEGPGPCLRRAARSVRADDSLSLGKLWHGSTRYAVRLLVAVVLVRSAWQA